MAKGRMRLTGWGAICAGAALLHCERSAQYDPKFPDQAAFRVHHLGTYSSKLIQGEEKEREGTIFQTRLSFKLEKQEGGWRLERRLDTLNARGYHKHSMPNELEHKADLKLSLGPDRVPAQVSGYESLTVILSRIPQKEEFRRQLLKASDTAAFKAWHRDWWRLLDFLPRGGEIEARKPLPVEAINAKLETFKADSARFDGPRPRGTNSKNRKTCLEYTLYYHRADSLALLVEQFFFSALQNRKYRSYTWRPGAVKGTVQFSVEQGTGLPCFHSRSETGSITLEKKEEKLEVPIELYRYEEDIYEY